jgi:hypothetical protein
MAKENLNYFEHIKTGEVIFINVTRTTILFFKYCMPC